MNIAKKRILDITMPQEFVQVNLEFLQGQIVIK